MKMMVTVRGTNVRGKAFEDKLEFTLLPPKEGTHYYGNGYYMEVKLPGDRKHIDIRYAGAVDIERHAEDFIKGFYGDNAKEVIKNFEETDQ